MSEAFTIVAKVLPVIFLIILGHFLSRFSVISQKTVDDLKKLVVNLTLPALLFMAFADTAFEPKYLLIVLAVFASCAVMLLLAGVLRKPLKIDNPYWPSLYAGFETGMMGYSIFVAVYGAAEMYKLAIMDLGQVTFVFFVLVSVLRRVNGETAGAVSLIKSFLKSPVILSIIFGIIAGLIGLPALL
ncbi:MAG: permease, partial [Clostridiaceae bacterium]|nr:permease [Clostridiaceae bacterium]